MLLRELEALLRRSPPLREMLMAPRRFRASRLALILSDPTRIVEAVVALCNVIIPGTAMMIGVTGFPQPTAWLLDRFLPGEQFIGAVAIMLGIAQIWAAGTDWYDARGLIATLIFCSLIVIIVAFWWTGFENRPTPYLMTGTVLAEMFLAWRCYHEKPVPVALDSPHARIR